MDPSPRCSRRSFSIAATSTLASVSIPRLPAGAAEFVYKLSWSWPPDHFSTVRLLTAAQRIGHESNGRIEIQIFPNGVLGSSAQSFAQVRLGAIQLLPAADAVVSSLIPVAGITAVPFAFPDRNAVFKALDGPLGKLQRDAISKANLYAFSKPWDFGFNHTINRVRPIVTMEDFRGLKIRTPESPIRIAIVKALGAAAIPISSTEIYTAIQARIVDGLDFPIDLIESWKLYEVTKYFSYTNHVYGNITLVMNGDSWRQLPLGLRDIVDRNFNAAALGERADMGRSEAMLEATLKGQGMIFNHPKISTEEYRAAVRAAGVYSQLRETYGADVWALIENSVGRLG